MSDSDTELYIPSYTKRHFYVNLDSDSDEEQQKEVSHTPIKRRKVATEAAPPAIAPQRPARRNLQPICVDDVDAISLSSSDDEDDGNDFESQMKLANDPVWQQAQEVLRKSQPVAVAISAALPLDLTDEDEMITLSVQWNHGDHGEQTNNFRVLKKDCFQALLDQFCQINKLQASTVRFVYDGAPINLQDTIQQYDLEENDIVNAIVDACLAPVAPKPASTPVPSEAKTTPAANTLRVKVKQANGKAEIYRISPSMKVEKLLHSFCNVHKLPPEEVSLKLFGSALDTSQTIDHYNIDEHDIIEVECKQLPLEDKNSVSISLRYLPSQETEVHRINTTALVETLIQKICTKRQLDANKVRFKIDGDVMHPKQPFTNYDIEGEELIDVTLL